MEIKPLLNKLLEKGYGWLSSLISSTDHTITKVSLFLQDKKKQLEDYLEDREVLLAGINQAQAEIDYLQNIINQTESEQKNYLLKLYHSLEIRTQELLNSQEQLNDLNQSIEKSKSDIDGLVFEKDQAVNERNFLRSEYDHLQNIIKENVAEQGKLNKKIESLRNNNRVDEQIEQQIRGHEEIIQELQMEKMSYEKQVTEFGIKLTEKMSLVAKLNGQLQQTKVDLHKKQEQVFQLEQKMNEYKQKVQHHGGEIKQLRLHIR